MSQPTRACPACHTPLPGMASFCYVCGTATPAGLNRATGEPIMTVTRSSIGPADLLRKLQRALGPGYELQDLIGAGGFAEVFRARDLRLKRDLAVKVLRPDLGLSPELLQRFRREAETIAALRNAHIVPVYDIGEAEGLAYIIMPLISGESLRAVIDRDGAMAADEVRRILREASLGLAAAHDAGVIHRDIKPENIMLEGRQKRVLLMDFGISKAVGFATDADPAVALTTTGVIIGTPQYMSPEQASGDKTIDARTDQYSLAVVGYRMLAGRLPFEGNSTRSVLYQQMVAEAAPITSKVAGVPTGLANAIQRAMAKEPAERFADMLEFSAMLDNDKPARVASRRKSISQAIGESLGTATGPALAKRPRAVLAAGALLAVVVLAGGWWAASRAGTGAPGAAPHAVVPPVTTPAAPAVATADSVARTDSTPAAPATAETPAPAAALKPPAAKAEKPTIDAKPNARTTARNTPKPGVAAAAPTCAAAAAAADWTAAASACAAEAAGGNAAAQRMLGTMYNSGNGVTADPAQAVSWYRRAAASNDPESEFLLSEMIAAGRGTPSNPAESAVHLRLAAGAGLLRAQQRLALRLEGGNGVKKDEAEAAVWFRRAAERGDMLSQQKLGEFLARGRGVPKNETEALDWYGKAATQGSSVAAWQLSQMYFKGRGTERSDSAGLVWLTKAAALNHPDAVKELKKRRS